MATLTSACAASNCKEARPAAATQIHPAPTALGGAKAATPRAATAPNPLRWWGTHQIHVGAVATVACHDERGDAIRAARVHARARLQQLGHNPRARVVRGDEQSLCARERGQALTPSARRAPRAAPPSAPRGPLRPWGTPLPPGELHGVARAARMARLSAPSRRPRATPRCRRRAAAPTRRCARG
eukprot:3436614-Prymnesium_polylepis.1